MSRRATSSAVDPGAMALQAAHDRAAPVWAAALVVLATTGLATSWVDLGPFWKSYVLDMTGPAWTYILVRGLYTRWVDNAWTRLFTPTRTFLILAAAAFTIEGLQYLKVYESTFDPWDLAAYLSLLGPVFVVDTVLRRRAGV